MHIFIHRYAQRIVLVGATLCSYTSFAQGVSIGSGAHVVVNGNANLQLNNASFTNNGSFVSSSGTVGVTGNSVTGPTLGGTSTSSFHILKVDRTGGPLTLEHGVEVTNQVNMVNGNIDLNNKVLDLGATGSLAGESENSRITGPTGGYIRAIADLNAPSSATPGNIGIEITSAVNMGSTEVRRAHTPFDVSTMDESINRYFYVIPTNNNNLGASVKFHYFDAELNAASEADLMMWSSTDNGSDWSLYGVNNLDIVNNFAVRAGLDTLSHITLSTNIIGDIPLSLTLLSFDAKAEGRQVNLDWLTSDEIGTSRFDVERSANGSSFEKIGQVTAKGSASTNHAYNFADIKPYSGANYYRLKMVDKDGKFSYSRIAQVNRASAQQNEVLAVFPNPCEASVNIRINSAVARASTVSVLNASGIVMAQQLVNLKEGEQVISLSLDKLAAGAYYIYFGTQDMNNVKFIKK